MIYKEVQTNHEIGCFAQWGIELPIIRDNQVKMRSTGAGGVAQELTRIFCKLVTVSTARMEKESKSVYTASKAILGKTFLKESEKVRMNE